jgi:pimeloyl-ACP methyl ester carboxylesterase
MPTFVLVHGGWHGGWCWSKVATALRAAGNDVLTPTLSGMGEREHLWTPDIGLETHTQDILSVLRFERLSNVILVGHSYGGTIITLVADRAPSHVAALVYVDAVIPENGVAGWHAFPEQRQQAMLAGAATLGGKRVPAPDPSLWGITDPADLAWVRACCTPHPIKTMFDVPQFGQAWQALPKHYILAGQNNNPRFSAHYATANNEPGWTTQVIDGGHDLMITAPALLTEALLQVANSTIIEVRSLGLD